MIRINYMTAEEYIDSKFANMRVAAVLKGSLSAEEANRPGAVNPDTRAVCKRLRNGTKGRTLRTRWRCMADSSELPTGPTLRAM